MAIVNEYNSALKSGKMNKKDKEVHRVIRGKEYVHTVNNEYNGPASEAQTTHRSNFGKINAIVNRIMADPVQVADFEQRMKAANAPAVTYQVPKPFKTVRQYVFAVIREQVEQSPMPPTQLPKGFKLHIRTFADLSTSELYEILKARYAVFTQEQGIIYLDEDDIDYIATHIFITRGAQVITYARLFRDKTETTLNLGISDLEYNDAIFCIGRMLTTVRGQRFGARLMHSVLAFAKRQNARTLRLHAQIPAVPFYERFGFHTVGEPFIEADTPHILMELVL